MKSNAIGFFVSLLLHSSLVLFAYSLAEKPTPKPSVEKVIPLHLSMFQEPVINPTKPVSKPPRVKTTTPAPPMTQAKPVQAKAIKPKPVVKKRIPPKTVNAKKISDKEKKPQKRQSVVKKQRIKPKTINKIIKAKMKAKTRDKALDEMIRAYQNTQIKQTVSTPQPRSQRINVATKQPTTPITAKKSAIKKPAPNGQAEQRYKARLQRFIAQQKNYPKRAKRRNEEGTVIVSFLLYANGTIRQIRIKKSSGSRHLDKAALQTIQRVSSTLLAFPPEIKRTQWSFSLPLVYRLR